MHRLYIAVMLLPIVNSYSASNNLRHYETNVTVANRRLWCQTTCRSIFRFVRCSSFVLRTFLDSFPLYVFNDRFAKRQIKKSKSIERVSCVRVTLRWTAVSTAHFEHFAFIFINTKKNIDEKISFFFLNYEWHITNTRHLISLFFFSSFQLHS